MISIRKANPVISKGTYKTLKNDNDKVYTFMRYQGDKKVIVAANLSDKPMDVAIDLQGKNGLVKVLYGSSKPVLTNSTIAINLPAYGVVVLGM